MEESSSSSMTPIQKQINLTDKQMFFYSNNIIHDIIHDYGFLTNKTRWLKNEDNVRQFLPGYTMSIKGGTNGNESGSESGSESDARPIKKRPRTDSIVSQVTNLGSQFAVTTQATDFSSQGNSSPVSQVSQSNTIGTPPYSPGEAIGTPPYSPGEAIGTPGAMEIDSPSSPYSISSDLIPTTNAVAAGIDDNVSDNEADTNSILNEKIVIENKYDYYECIEQIKNSTIFHFFGFIVDGLKKKVTNTTVNCFELAYNIIVPTAPSEYESEYNIEDPLFNKYCEIAENFGIYLYQSGLKKRLSVPSATIDDFDLSFDLTNLNDINILYSILVCFLDTDTFFSENSIFLEDSVFLEDSKPSGDSLVGGDPTPEEIRITGIKNAITDIMYKSEFYNNIVSIIENVSDATEEQRIEYNRLFNDMADNIYGLFDSNPHLKPTLKSGQELNRDYILKLIKTDLPFKQRDPQKTINRLNENLLKGEKKILENINKKLSESQAAQIKQQAAAAKSSSSKKKSDAKSSSKKDGDEADSDEESGLGELDTVRKQFLNAIATLGLFLNGVNTKLPVTDINSYLNTNYTDDADANLNHLLSQELSILLYYADIKIQKEKVKGKEIIDNSFEIVTKGKKDLDTILFNAVKATIGKLDEPIGQYLCNKPGPGPFNLYMIDNAAVLPKEERGLDVFCPLSSIVDGMNQCTLGSSGIFSANSIEYGNMDFVIKNKNRDVNSYYNGKLNLSNGFGFKPSNTKFASYEIKFKCINPTYVIQTSVDNISITDGKILDLEAHHILKNVFINLLKIIIQNVNNHTVIGDFLLQTSLSSEYNIFRNIIDIIIDDNITLRTDSPQTINVDGVDAEIKNNLLQAIFTILGKGGGDIFQEINVVCKNGGYTEQPSYNIKHKNYPIIPWDSYGNGLRCFAANDRPSAARFIFLVKYGDANEINNYAFGGFMSSVQECVVKREELRDQCVLIKRYGASRGGKTNKKHTKKLKRKLMFKKGSKNRRKSMKKSKSTYKNTKIHKNKKTKKDNIIS